MILLQSVPPVVSEAVSWVSIVKDLGTIGVLAVGTYLFLTGKLVSGKVADKTAQTAVNAARMAASKELVDSIRKAVKDGFIEGWYEIHHSHEEAVEKAVSAAKESEEKTVPRKR